MRKTILTTVLATLLFTIATGAFANLYPAKRDTIDEVIVFNLGKAIPEGARVLGTFKIGDKGFTTDCQYQPVLEKAQEKAQKAGGNAIQITELKQPDLWSSCYRIKGNILSIDDPEPFRQSEKDGALGSALISDTATFATLYIYRPKNFNGAAIGFDVYLDDSVICRAVNNSKYEIKIYKTGKHKIWAKTEAKAIVPLSIKFGKEYYLKCSIITGLWVGQPSINLIDGEQGKGEFQMIKGRKEQAAKQ